MERFVRGDVVVLDFPFSNLLQVKRRPALIVKIPKGGDAIVSQITGKSQESSLEVQINKKDFKEGGLKIDSYLRLDKFFSIERSIIKYKAGSLKPEKFKEIIDRIISFLRD
ncbi:MAG: type II toxin-antitoxin system PemK/MazF family toxin [Nanoarchaeota archaeon]